MPSDKLDNDEIQPLLFDLVKMDKLDEVNRLLPQFSLLTYEIKHELIKLAASHGSLAMVQLLVEPNVADHRYHGFEYAALGSSESENIEVFDWTLTTGKPSYGKRSYGKRWVKITSDVMRSSSAELFEIWDKKYAMQHLHVVTYRSTIEAASKNPVSDARLRALWKREAISGKLKRNMLGSALAAVAKSTCSIVQAKTLMSVAQSLTTG